MDTTMQSIFDGIIQGDASSVEQGVRDALDRGDHPGTILNEAMITAMAEVGKRFENGEYFVPEMLVSARAMKTGLGILRPILASNKVESIGKVVIGTVKGDLHDIGKNLVSMMLEGAGFEIFDLGTDVTPAAFVETARAKGADILAMSALLTTTMPSMLRTIDALKEMGVRDSVKVIVGGAPLTQEFAEQIGADGFAPDASRAVALARGFL
jgi:5-methyltetrahydrofolate--homocysteine methyltransferase